MLCVTPPLWKEGFLQTPSVSFSLRTQLCILTTLIINLSRKHNYTLTPMSPK